MIARTRLLQKTSGRNRSQVRETHVLVVIIALLGGAAVARAQDTSSAPAGTRALSATPFQLVLSRKHLLSDRYGVRSWLEEHGITPTFTFVTDALGNPTGGQRQGFTTGNNVGLDLSFDLEKLGGPKGGSFQISMSERFGTSLSGSYIGNVFSVQANWGENTYRLVNVAYRQKLLDDRIEFQIGRIAAGDDFLVSTFLGAARRFLVFAAFLPAALDFRVRAAFFAAKPRFVDMGFLSSPIYIISHSSSTRLTSVQTPAHPSPSLLSATAS